MPISKEYRANWNAKNPEKIKEYKKRYREKLRRAFVEMYGGKCACCGDTRFPFLTLDHIHNDGYIRRGGRCRDGQIEYRNALREYQPKIYQVLCMNCNCAKSWYGECPCKNYLQS